MDCNRDWSYLTEENEYHLAESPNFVVEEYFLKGKKNPDSNEDGILVTPYFAAVIDGATSKSDFELDGKRQEG